MGEKDLGIKKSIETIKNISRLIETHKIQSHLRFLGFREDVRDIMSISDLFVHSSLSEAFGLVLLEAMSEGLQIVSSKVDAISEIVPETDNFLIKKDDLIGFRKSVEFSLKRSEDLKKEISLRNFKTATQKKYSQNERTKNMFNYFKQIINKRID